MTFRGSAFRAMLLAAAFLPGACTGLEKRLNEVTEERDEAVSQLARERRRSQELERELEDRQRQIDVLLALGDKRLDRLFNVVSVAIGGRSGGIDTDAVHGDDAVKVLLEPMDQDGSIIKAAGEVKIQLYDLAAPPERNLVAERAWSLDEVAKLWYGGFLAYHYSFVCPWRSPPRHEDITVRVEFKDYLTGRTFTAQRVCKVRLSSSATQPATSPTSSPAP